MPGHATQLDRQITDTVVRCWTTLGVAVRTAQSLGFHVEHEDVKYGEALLRAENRRRTWYCIYVLDRLLSLQLGRPPAIHDEDIHLSLPSRIGDEEIDWEDKTCMQLLPPEGTSTGDYFLCVIALSKLIGRVFRGLDGFMREKKDPAWIYNAKVLDNGLHEWKQSLPRTLRFDLGHTFETSMTFKRQVCEINASVSNPSGDGATKLITTSDSETC
jgi:hypothetical protein